MGDAPEQLVVDDELRSQLDKRLAGRTSISKEESEATEEADCQLSARLSQLVESVLDAPPLSADPAALVNALHCLVCVVALSPSACRHALREPIAVVSLAMQAYNVLIDRLTALLTPPELPYMTFSRHLAAQAATPAGPEDLALPVRVQHLALMLLVNATVTGDGAAAGWSIAPRAPSESCQMVADWSVAPRAPSESYQMVAGCSVAARARTTFS